MTFDDVTSDWVTSRHVTSTSCLRHVMSAVVTVSPFGRLTTRHCCCCCCCCCYCHCCSVLLDRLHASNRMLWETARLLDRLAPMTAGSITKNWLRWPHVRDDTFLYVMTRFTLLQSITARLTVMLSSHRRHGQDKTVLSRLDPVSNFQVFSSPHYIRDGTISNWKMGRVKTKLSCLVANSGHTADMDKTRQDSFVLSV